MQPTEDGDAGRSSSEGQGAVIWVIATADGPMTTRDVSEQLEMTQDAARVHMLRSYRDGYLLRERRNEVGNPYEYRIKPRGYDNDPDKGEQETLEAPYA